MCEPGKCPHELSLALFNKDLVGLGARANDMNSQIQFIDKKTDDHAMEISTIKNMISNYTSQSQNRHDDLKGYVVSLGDNLNKHMETEEKELKLHQTENKLFVKESLDPIKGALDALNSRWWSIMIAIIGLLGSGLVGTIVYLWNHREFIPSP